MRKLLPQHCCEDLGFVGDLGDFTRKMGMAAANVLQSFLEPVASHPRPPTRSASVKLGRNQWSLDKAKLVVLKGIPLKEDGFPTEKARNLCSHVL